MLHSLDYNDLFTKPIVSHEFGKTHTHTHLRSQISTYFFGKTKGTVKTIIYWKKPLQLC